jgi:queuine/archaeosine tRNA-ribosyltransferase
MRFYFPDSQDQIDPSFDFETEERSPFRIRQRDDHYAHEALSPPPYSGMLVSKAIVDGVAGGAGRYSAQQRQRLYREGVREFFRLNGESIDTLGDCGAFTYLREDEPPYSVDEVIDFYENVGFDSGIALDHVILGFDIEAGLEGDNVDPQWRQRRDLTLELAAEFLKRHRERRCSFDPVGVAQGWSPASYAASVATLQDIGYTRIALGGLIAQKTPEIKAVLAEIATVRATDTGLHLLGVTRCESIPEFATYGVVSFDSTSPFRQAFKDDRDNYWTIDGTHVALRVPQVEGNAKLQSRIRAGEIDQKLARRLERIALQELAAFDRGDCGIDDVVEALRAYELVHDQKRDRSLWRECDCDVCSEVGIQVIIFRGTERNKRRGFHNLHVFAKRLKRQLEIGVALV